MALSFFKKNCLNAILPTRCIDNTFGYELFSVYTTVIRKKSCGMIKIGISFEPTFDTVMLIIGQIIKIGNSLFEVKHEYIGKCNDIIIKLDNLSNEDVEILPHTPLTKVFLLKTNGGNIKIVNDLDETVRGEKGFGSSGND